MIDEDDERQHAKWERYPAELARFYEIDEDDVREAFRLCEFPAKDWVTPMWLARFCTQFGLNIAEAARFIAANTTGISYYRKADPE